MIFLLCFLFVFMILCFNFIFVLKMQKNIGDACISRNEKGLIFIGRRTKIIPQFFFKGLIFIIFVLFFMLVILFYTYMVCNG